MPQPPSAAVTTTAVSGMSTSRLNHSIATPSPSAAPGVRVLRGVDRRVRRGRRPSWDAGPVSLGPVEKG